MLVTGGAGFIGANFVHQTVRAAPGCPVTVLDALTYAGNRASLDPSPTASTSSRATSPTPTLVDSLVTDSTWSSTSPPNPTTTTPCTTRGRSCDTNVIGTYQLLQAVRRHDVRYHHISTDEVYGDLELDDPANSPSHPLQPVEPLLLHQGGLRPAGPRLGPDFRCPRHHLQLLEQLRPVPARGEVHPPPDHQRYQRRAPQALRRRARTSATGSTSRTTTARCWAIHRARPASGETYLIGADGERSTSPSLRSSSRHGREPDDFDL